MSMMRLAHTALLQRIPASKLTPEVKAAFKQLVELLLNLGNNGTSGVYAEPLKALWPLFPQLTIQVYRPIYLKGAIVRDAIDAEQWKANTLPGTYFTVADLEDSDALLRHLKSFAPPQLGLYQVFVNLGPAPGIGLAQFVWLLRIHAQLLTDVVSAKQLRDLQTLAVKNPAFAITMVPKPRPITYDSWELIYSPGSKQFYNRAQFDTLRNSLGDQGHKSPLEKFRGKHIVMIGAPPRGWSTQQFADALANVNAQVVKQFSNYTTVAFYDPAVTGTEKVKEAQSRGITMVPYLEVIDAISHTSSRHDVSSLQPKLAAVPHTQYAAVRAAHFANNHVFACEGCDECGPQEVTAAGFENANPGDAEKAVIDAFNKTRSLQQRQAVLAPILKELGIPVIKPTSKDNLPSPAAYFEVKAPKAHGVSTYLEVNVSRGTRLSLGFQHYNEAGENVRGPGSMVAALTFASLAKVYNERLG